MDRKAHHAAQARALREAAQLAEKSAQSEAAQRAELEQKKQQARTAWEQKREGLHTNLTREQIELQMQMRKVRDQFSQIAARLRYEQDTSTELRHKVQDERGRIQAEEQLLATLRGSASQSEAQVEGIEQGRSADDPRSAANGAGAQGLEGRPPARAAYLLGGALSRSSRRESPADLRRMHGRGRDLPPRPSGHVGHVARVPDRPQSSRRHSRRRAQRSRAPHRPAAREKDGASGDANAKPYLLLLVRPDGINTNDHFQAVLRDMPLEFGYEFIDADWVLDFPADDDQPNAQPWMTTAKIPSSASPAAPSRIGGARPLGLPAQSASGASSSTVARGWGTGEGPGTGRWVEGSAGSSGTGASGPGSRPGSSASPVAGGDEIRRAERRTSHRRRPFAERCVGANWRAVDQPSGSSGRSLGYPVWAGWRIGILARLFKWPWCGWSRSRRRHRLGARRWHRARRRLRAKRWHWRAAIPARCLKRQGAKRAEQEHRVMEDLQELTVFHEARMARADRAGLPPMAPRHRRRREISAPE